MSTAATLSSTVVAGKFDVPFPTQHKSSARRSLLPPASLQAPRFLIKEHTNKTPSWGIFNSLFGWQNSATYGSVIGYNVFWIFVILGFVLMRFKENNGRYPFMSAKSQSRPAIHTKDSDEESSTGSGGRNGSQDKTGARELTEVKA
jgi:Iron permease FTR1 family